MLKYFEFNTQVAFQTGVEYIESCSIVLQIFCVDLLLFFQNSSRLKSLNLAWNGLGDEGTLAVADCIRNNHLIHTIDITSNRITPDGAYILSKGLEANETLQTLAVSFNGWVHYTWIFNLKWLKLNSFTMVVSECKWLIAI